MQGNNLLHEPTKYVFPLELIDYFDLVSLEENAETLHLYLDERNVIPGEYESIELSPNGFYPESMIKDFPLRDKKVILHVRRRRWTDNEGKSYSREWDLTAEGTRYSKEFAYFLKEAFGYLPDSSPIS
ncbi:MAG: hypothetical protein LBP64_05870 [Tannerella sp.]|jgi:hypothetical protein|nr:hypothetical protein [Tannerella sp.]